jgi:hypothetical protein
MHNSKIDQFKFHDFFPPRILVEKCISKVWHFERVDEVKIL